MKGFWYPPGLYTVLRLLYSSLKSSNNDPSDKTITASSVFGTKNYTFLNQLI